MTGLYWLSFADSARPEGKQFLGAAIVGPAESLAHAVMLAHALGCNPGGEVVGQRVPDPVLPMIKPTDMHRLMTRAECDEFTRRIQRH